MLHISRVSRRKLVLVLSIMIVSSVVALILFLFVLPWLDWRNCVPRVAERIGVKPNYPEIANYIDRTLVSGMSREEVFNVLNDIGEVDEKIFRVETPDQLIRETVAVRMCWHPVNVQVFELRFSMEGVFVRGGLVLDP